MTDQLALKENNLHSVIVYILYMTRRQYSKSSQLRKKRKHGKVKYLSQKSYSTRSFWKNLV